MNNLNQLKVYYDDNYQEFECLVLAIGIDRDKLYIQCLETGEKGWCNSWLTNYEEY